MLYSLIQRVVEFGDEIIPDKWLNVLTWSATKL
jgi:hypothetical protein